MNGFSIDVLSGSKTRNFIMGPMQMVFSSAGFAFMSYFAKLATKELASTEVTFFRLFAGTLVALIVIATRNSRLVNENIKLLVSRGILSGIACLLFFVAIEKGTITNSVVLQNTYPIFAAVISIYALKEKMSLRILAVLIMTFGGVVILTRPDISHIKAGDMLALASGVIAGFSVTAVRRLRKRNESVWTIFFYFCFLGAIISFFLALPDWKWPNANGWFLVLMTSLLGLVGQVCMTSAYKYCTATIGGILSMSTGVFSFAIGVMLLGESFLAMDLIGVFIIISGNVLVTMFDGDTEKNQVVKGRNVL